MDFQCWFTLLFGKPCHHTGCFPSESLLWDLYCGHFMAAFHCHSSLPHRSRCVKNDLTWWYVSNIYSYIYILHIHSTYDMYMHDIYIYIYTSYIYTWYHWLFTLYIYRLTILYIRLSIISWVWPHLWASKTMVYRNLCSIVGADVLMLTSLPQRLRPIIKTPIV